MPYKKWQFVFLAGSILVAIAAAAAIYFTPHLPPLKDGDLVFQTSLSNQSKAIAFATASAFTHMGIVEQKGDDFYVLETAGKVQETPLQQWLKRGLFRRVSIYRNNALNAEQRVMVIKKAKSYEGLPYDIYFSFDDRAMYCSELPYKAYKSAGITLGTIQTPSELNVDNALVRALIKKRWATNPACQQHGDDFAQCYQRILAQPLITPVSIAHDTKLTEIYSNYPF